MGPNTAFVVMIFGILGIYVELVRPGRAVPGLLGFGAAVSGAFFLLRPPLSGVGVMLLSAGVTLLIAEALWGPYWLQGSLGVVAVTAGFSVLSPGSRRLAPALCVPVCLVFGAATTFLAAGAKRARRNKRLDLDATK